MAWYKSLKATGGFGPVHPEIMDNGRQVFESERVSDTQTLEMIAEMYKATKYVLDPHSAVGVAGAKRSMSRASNVPHIALSTAHPAKFSGAVELALKDQKEFDFTKQVLPEDFVGLAEKEKRVTEVAANWQEVREIVKKQVEEDLKAESSA